MLPLFTSLAPLPSSQLDTGEDIACPVYGPTYKGNLLFAYFFGGLKRVSQMPKCRMPLSLLEDVMKGTWE